jgi:hypothetical protein
MDGAPIIPALAAAPVEMNLRRENDEVFDFVVMV